MSKLKAKQPEPVATPKVKGLMFGPSGVGKTWFATSFPRPYYIDCESGAKLSHYLSRIADAGGVYMGANEGSLDFETVIGQMQALATEPHPYKTLILDSITKLYQTCIANEAERLGDKDAFGASKKPAIANMRRLVNWAMRLDMNIWFVSHETAEWGADPKTGQRTEIGKVPDVWDKLIYELDLTLWVQKRGGSRVAIVKKSRLTGFPDLDTFELEYEAFSARYGKDIIEREVKNIVLATKDQVDQINLLLQHLKISEHDIEKIFTRAGADKWEELTTEQADQTIAFFNRKLTGNK